MVENSLFLNLHVLYELHGKMFSLVKKSNQYQLAFSANSKHIDVKELMEINGLMHENKKAKVLPQYLPEKFKIAYFFVKKIFY